MPDDVTSVLLMLLQHPATWSLAALSVAFAFGLWVRRQLRRVGVMELEDGVRWSLAWSALATLLATVFLEGVLAHRFGMAPIAQWLGMAFGKGLTLVPALLVLSGAGWYSVSRRGTAREVSPQVETELRWVRLGAGATAALSVAQAPLLPLVVLIGAAGFAWWYRSTPDAAQQLRGWSEDVNAGNLLRSRLKADATVDLDGKDVAVIGRAGLLSTDVLTDEGVETVPNRTLAAAAKVRRTTA